MVKVAHRLLGSTSLIRYHHTNTTVGKRNYSVSVVLYICFLVYEFAHREANGEAEEKMKKI